MPKKLFSFQLKGFNKLLNQYLGIEKRLSKPTLAQQIIVQKAYKDVIDHFDKEEGPGHNKWRKLKKPRKRGGSKILQNTGALRSSISKRITGTVMEIFTNLRSKKGFDYPKLHNEGGKDKKIRPQRKFMYLSRDALESIKRTLIRFIARGK